MDKGNFTRDDWATIPLAMNSLASALMAAYPQSGVAQEVSDQYKIAQQNMQTMKDEETARQAAKAAHRKANQSLGLGALATAGGAGIGGLAGAPMMGAQMGAQVGKAAGGADFSGMMNSFQGMFKGGESGGGNAAGSSAFGPYAGDYKFPQHTTPTVYDNDLYSQIYGGDGFMNNTWGK